MAVSRPGLAFCLVAILAFLPGAAPAQGWGWSVNPGGPSAGDTMKVDVWTAPCQLVSVEFWVDGVFQYSADVQVPGVGSWTVPANYTGRRWQVRVVCPGSSESNVGTFG